VYLFCKFKHDFRRINKKRDIQQDVPVFASGACLLFLGFAGDRAITVSLNMMDFI
jgi:hypothetical protein